MKILWQSENLNTIQVHCYKCGSILEIEESDLEFSEFHHDKVYNCPVCNNDNPIDRYAETLLNSLEEVRNGSVKQ